MGSPVSPNAATGPASDSSSSAPEIPESGWLRRAVAPLDDHDPPTEAKVRSFEALFLIAFVGEYWSRTLLAGGAAPWPYVAACFLATLAAVPAWRPRTRRFGFAALAAIHLVVSALELPATSNHSYFEIAICLVAALLDVRRREERVLYLRAMRTMVLVILLFSGVQKLAHGYWLDGHYLAFSMPRDTYATGLGLLLGEAERARLTGLDGQLGAGPYLPAGPALVLLSNATWILEIALAVLLVPRRTRPFAMAAAVLLMLGIEAVARELFFGLIFVNALLLFSRDDGPRRLIPVYALAVAALLLVRAGLLPEFTFR